MITENMRLIERDPNGLKLGKAYLEAIEAQDVGALKRVLHPRVELTHSNYPPVYGRDEAADMIEGYLSIIDGVEFEIRTAICDEKLIAIEKVNIARAAKGAIARIRVVTILEFDDDGLITSIRIYADTADLFQHIKLNRVLT